MTTNEEYYTLGMAARVLACKPHHINYLLVTRTIPEPLRIGGGGYSRLAILLGSLKS